MVSPPARSNRLSSLLASLDRWSRKRLSFLYDRLLWKLSSAIAALWLTGAVVVYHFEHGVKDANINSLGDSIWWGIVTLLTVGYGDRYPVTLEGRLVGGVLMFSGVVAIGILTAKISSEFFEQVLRNQRGEIVTDKLKDHIIVCGFKDDMTLLLEHVLDFNPGLPANRLVLVAHVSDEILATFRANPRLKEIQVLSADFTQEAQLRRVAPERARKILLLSDRSPQPNGGIASVKETDARTLMAAMVLSHIARGVPISAEILDSSMDSYLRMSGVTEIIHSRQYNRLLLANASGKEGLSSIIFDLMDPNNQTMIKVEEIPAELVGRSYQELQSSFAAAASHRSLIGVLENTGNSFQIKAEALRKAQKTANVEDLVKNLRAVKRMQFNRPVFNPPQSYKIGPGTTAIVIETLPGANEAEAGAGSEAAA